ncbi:DNA-binding protein [Bremerella cremea]|uniref:DNA-binding protein n=1 Tax=Bremerella cremea TaxID=1031537 RepID=A0A368KQQ6_9BACT|nr:DNA-binding protein [Bremerella cremea]
MSKSKSNPLLLAPPKEAAAILGISPRLLWQLTKNGEIACVRIGTGKRKRVRYAHSDLDEFVKNNTHVSPKYSR